MRKFFGGTFLGTACVFYTKMYRCAPNKSKEKGRLDKIHSAKFRQQTRLLKRVLVLVLALMKVAGGGDGRGRPATKNRLLNGLGHARKGWPSALHQSCKLELHLGWRRKEVLVTHALELSDGRACPGPRARCHGAAVLGRPISSPTTPA